MRHRIDPESWEPLAVLLEQFPGGVNAIADLHQRRAVDERLSLEWAQSLGDGPHVQRQDVQVPGPASGADVTLRIYRPETDEPGQLPGIYFIHGGGMILGSLESEDHIAAMLCEELLAVVVSVDYRLAPEHPYPAGVRDCYAGWQWMCGQYEALGVDPTRIALYGGSAGGGLAIACALMSRDMSGPEAALLMALYPMVDDRNETQSSHEVVDVGVWDRAAGLEAWQLYLSGQPADGYAAPAREPDLAGLPRTFIDVGTVDLFRDEVLTLSARLMQAQVPMELHVYPGAYHASELVAPEALLSRRIWAERIRALADALGPQA